MKNIILVKAKIESISPLYIGDDEGNVLIDEEENKAYLPATSVAGSFRSYLESNNENYKELFGYQDSENANMSKIFISDSYSNINTLDKRIGVKIDGKTGTNVDGGKIDKTYLGEGLVFELTFEIHCTHTEIEKFKNMLYKCLKALHENHIRLGGDKTKGLGNFKVINVEELTFKLSNKEDLFSYLIGKYKKMDDITHKVLNTELEDNLVEFNMRGEFTTPVLIKAPGTFESSGPDNENLKSGNYNIIPGSTFKGILRSQVEKISDYFGNKNIVENIFGDDNKKIMSRIMVNEAKIDEEGYKNDIVYNRIKIDKFTGGARDTALMNDKPVMGRTEFKIIYKKVEDDKLNNFIIGILSLALRDLGTENLTIGGGASIGRGRFKAYSMLISDGQKEIEIDFENEKIKGQDKLEDYIEGIRNYKES
ncbi:hypothetical protein KQH90_07110 [Anaerosalibacter bizertensis]|uniref:RAMP superfamily CRISPR-associated protein n=1 Tax=Anaerosalibacter bizertensis TaxID=932217 RepID=UPI001C0EE374|nr:RAMP superfamily CRISPR-associated protein [Anaerosalibacter bizertensis]MBU5293801.1 hypothetical protein [Anaerosalibacter bizertensis]